MEWPRTGQAVHQKPVVCQCGCAEPVAFARQTRPEYGHVIGHPYKFKGGHQRRLLPTNYYPVVRDYSKPHHGVKAVHLIRAEKALGHPLPKGATVHHADLTKRADSPLVICEHHAYHMFLHIRTHVVWAGGDPNTQRVCSICKHLRPIDAMVKSAPRDYCEVRSYCKNCYNDRRRQQWTVRHNAAVG